MNFKILFVVSVLIFGIACSRQTNTESTAMTEERIADRLAFLSSKMVENLSQLPRDSTRIPRAIDENGDLIAQPSRQWTSGFFPGILWQLYDFSDRAELKEGAEKWTIFLKKEQWDTHTHDLGFKLNSSFGKAYEITGDEAYKDVVIQASKTLIKRFNNDIGVIRSWDWNADIWQYPVIIDNMMNLEMLFEATEYTGDSTFYKVAEKHASTTLKNHYRPDNSSYHVVVYDTTTFVPDMKVTHQGFSSESAWSRGQAWGLYGYTEVYEKTKDVRYLDQAKKIAAFYINHKNMPEDLIPYWDFDAPGIPNEPRDVSAATVAASALIKLSDYVQNEKEDYLNYADGVLLSLEKEDYQTNKIPFLLDHSTGSVPGKFEVDVPIVYADYYYVESLLRRLHQLEKNTLSIQ